MNAHTAKVREFFDSDAYLTHNPIVRVRARLVAELLSDLRGGRVLDLGCGDGSISQPLLAAGNDVTFVDVSDAMLARAQEAAIPSGGGRAEYVQADVLGWEPESEYDAVLCVGLLAHVASPERALEQAARATRVGGRCVVQITDAGRALGWLLTRYAQVRPRKRYRLNRLSSRDLALLAGRHGLRPIDERRYGLLVPMTGRLPYPWQRSLEERFAHGFLARAGADTLLVLRKEGDVSPFDEAE
jgi:SAM-dependent methyltransferase